MKSCDDPLTDGGKTDLFLALVINQKHQQ